MSEPLKTWDAKGRTLLVVVQLAEPGSRYWEARALRPFYQERRSGPPDSADLYFAPVWIAGASPKRSALASARDYAAYRRGEGWTVAVVVEESRS
jgi:hypothetical protein